MPETAALSARSTLARLVLGSTFHPLDLPAYLAGVAAAALGHALLVRARRCAG